MIKRLIYLGYYLTTDDLYKLFKFINYVNLKNGISKRSLYYDIFRSSLVYNISLLEFFYFKFYEISKSEMEKYAGTGTMYEYELIMNPKKTRYLLADKLKFLEAYMPFIRHTYFSLNDVYDVEKTEKVLNNKSKKIVLKNSKGQCGIGVEVREASEFNTETLIKRLHETGNDFVEEFVQQHDELNRLSPSGLNTIRIITQLNDKDEVEILGARLRITINSSVDNLAAGNIAAPIDEQSGIVTGPGVYSDITKEDEYKHPVTGIEIVGFQIPFWVESLQMVRNAALMHPQNRSIGWDVAITNVGPELIEGNHDWCKLLWQLPVKKGLKPILDKHKNAYLKIS